MKTAKSKKRPQLLSWLCVGSFAFGILWIIMLLALIFFEKAGKASTQYFPGIAIEYLQVGYVFIFAEILLTALGIFAVAMMWRMQKTGFYLYATSKTIIYFLPAVFLGINQLTYPGLIITSILIVFYGIMLTAEPIK